MSAVPANALQQLERAVLLLREAKSFDEVEKIRAMAAAAAAYARAEKLGDEAIKHATDIRIRAARRAGEILAAMTEKAKGAAQPGIGRRGKNAVRPPVAFRRTKLRRRLQPKKPRRSPQFSICS